MSKIKLYIVTYKRNEILNRNLKSLWSATHKTDDIEVTILANHPDIVIDNENKRSNLKVVINTTRMPHAWGYLSRDWNFCILDCFKTWQNPENVDWCVLAQNDVTWVDGWDEWLRKNKDYDFISQPRGDQCMAINVDAVKKIGFFDERFTIIFCQESDFFRRAKTILKQRASINDDHTSNSINDGLQNVLTQYTYSGTNILDDTLHTGKWCEESVSLLFSKWNIDRNKYFDFLDKNIPLKKVPREINWYPYFWDGLDNKSFFSDDYFIFNAVRNITRPPFRTDFTKFLKRMITCFIPSKKLRKKIRESK